MIKFLVVEDNDDIRESIVQILQVSFEGCLCYEASNGKIAEEIFVANAPFDLIISDINMPNGDGYFLLERISQLSPDTKLIFFTNEIYLQNFNHSHSKFHGFVHKLDVHGLISKVKMLLLS